MRKHPFAGFAAGVLLLLSACGDDDEPAAPSEAASSSAADVSTTTPAGSTVPATAAASAPASAAPTSVAAPDSSAAPADGPQAIVSLAPTHTETLFAIGAGDQVIAVDDQSDFPVEAAAVASELSGFEPNVEAIAGYEPDLVVLSDATIQPQLESLGIEVWVGTAPATFEDAFTQIEQLGAVTGQIGEAAELVGQMRTDIDAIVAAVTPPAEPLSIYHELDDTYFSVNSETFIGEAYTELGLRNIADTAEGDSGGYPQLNAEAIISADPDLIFLADAECCGVTLETLSARPGWQDIAAVANGNVFAVDDDVASRWGPRLVDYVQFVADAVSQVAVTAGG